MSFTMLRDALTSLTSLTSLCVTSCLLGCVEPYPPLPATCFPDTPQPASLARLSSDSFYSDRCCRNDDEGIIEDCAGIFAGLVPQDYETHFEGTLYVSCRALQREDGSRGDPVCVHDCADGICECSNSADCCPEGENCSLKCKSADARVCEERFGVPMDFCLFCQAPEDAPTE